MRGRPAVTRARLLGFVSKHWPCPVRQICNATGAERSYVKRVLKQEGIDTSRFLPPSQGGKPAVDGTPMNRKHVTRGHMTEYLDATPGWSSSQYLVGGTAKGATSDELEQRQAIRQMCRYIADDAKVARHHAVSLEKVRQIRAAMPNAKVKGLGVAKPQNGPVRSQNATGADAANPFKAEKDFKDMLCQGSAMLREAVLDALVARIRMVG